MEFTVGQRVRILKDIVEHASGDWPANICAKEGDIVIIRYINPQVTPKYPGHIHVSHPHRDDDITFTVDTDEIESIDDDVQFGIRKHPYDSHIVHLKPCPCCGTYPEFLEDIEDMTWFASCPHCGLILGEPNGYSSRLDLCNDWNRRADVVMASTIPADDLGIPLEDVTDIETLRDIAVYLYNILDRIDKAGDADLDEYLYRRLVTTLHQDRFNTMEPSEDGLSLHMHTGYNPEKGNTRIAVPN